MLSMCRRVNTSIEAAIVQNSSFQGQHFDLFGRHMELKVDVSTKRSVPQQFWITKGHHFVGTNQHVHHFGQQWLTCQPQIVDMSTSRPS